MAMKGGAGCRPRLVYVFIAFTMLLTVFFYGGVSPISGSSPTAQIPFQLPSGARQTNSTLGFGGIYVVSGPGSPRRWHIEEAAAVTDLHLTIPDQKTWTDQDLAKFQIPDRNNSRLLEGSIKAWLSHHLVLRAFLESGQETALFLEDDVDWDIRLKSVQVPLAQHAARSLFGKRSNPSQYPWGSSQDWDLLYVGHCGDYLNDINDGVGVGYHHPEDLNGMQHVLFADPTIPALTDLHPYTSSLFSAFQIPDRTRVLHRSKWPLCTFGYAVTRRTAERLLTELAPPKEAPQTSITAFDAAILTACRDGPLKCFTLQPEVFHHQEGQSLIGRIDNTHKAPVDEKGLSQTRYRGETSNIDCGFWSGHFYYEGDLKKLAWLREEITRQGRCIKQGHIRH